MSRKLVEKRKIDTKTILESYQPSNKVGPILGTFTVKDVITENTISKNNTLYPTETLESPYAFGRGGRFFDENGKLIPAKLMGSLDHPADGNSPEVRLESAISWKASQGCGMVSEYLIYHWVISYTWSYPESKWWNSWVY